MVKSECVRVPKAQGEAARRALAGKGLLVRGLKIKRVGDELVIPVMSSSEALRVLEEAGIRSEACVDEFPEYSRKGGVPLEGAVKSYVVVGDIAVFSWRAEAASIEDYRRAAERLLETQPRIKAAYLKLFTEGEYRVKELVHLAGEKRTRTLHREYGLGFHVDISKVYFNPRLGYEHRRVAELVSDGERVLDMFSGVGPFSIHIASLRRAKVISVDLNPYASYFAALNVVYNRKKLKGDVVVLRADSALLPGILKPVFDRIIMNNPRVSRRYVDVACKLSAKKSVIHYYLVSVSSVQAEDDTVDAFKSECKGNIEVLGVREVLAYGPGEGVYAVDLMINKD